MPDTYTHTTNGALLMLTKTTVPILDETTAAIPLGRGRYTIVDAALYKHLMQWHWFAKQSGCTWYAVRKVTTKNSVYFVRLHRQITHCPRDKVVHHVNARSLDNRLANLLPMSPWQHNFFH